MCSFLYENKPLSAKCTCMFICLYFTYTYKATCMVLGDSWFWLASLGPIGFKLNFKFTSIHTKTGPFLALRGNPMHQIKQRN